MQSETKPGLAEPAAEMDFDVANRLFFRLYQCSNLLHKNGTRHVSSHGATTQQWAVLGALARPIARDSGMSVKQLILYLLLSRQNLTAVLERLESAGWIERVKDPSDGRARRIRLSQEGARRWNDMLVDIEGFYAGVLAEFSQAEQTLMMRLLDRLKTGLEAV